MSDSFSGAIPPGNASAEPARALPGGVATRAWAWPKYLMLAIIAAAFVNAAAFIAVAANPLIASDAWYFLDAFIRESVNGTLGLGDFLVKRAGLDHSQPLNKIALLFHYRYFDLDFQVEAWIGLLFALAGVVVLYRMAARDAHASGHAPVLYMGMAAIAAVYVSLNSALIFSYSLLTLAYVTLFLALASISGAWAVLGGRNAWWLGVPLALLGIAADNVAMVTGLALLLVAAWHGLRMGSPRRLWTVALVVVGVLLVTRVFLAVFGEIRGDTLAAFNVGAGERVHGLLARMEEWWRWVLIPASASIAHVAQLKSQFGDSWEAARLVTGLLVMLAQLWFWWSVWRARPSGAAFAAICVMLLAYGLWAGVLYGRVFVRGAEYLQQPRYVLFYQLNIVALLLMGIARGLQAEVGRRRWPGAFLGAALLLVAVQIPLSHTSWTESRFQLKYYQRMAAQMRELAANPAQVPAGCVPTLVACQMPAAQRAELVGLLEAHRLNLFSPDFQARHPELATARPPP